MAETVILDNVDHAGLRVVVAHGAAYGDAVNQLLVFPTEFRAVQREFPILFVRDPDGAWQSVAITGLERDSNLFLNDGRWETRYVPAVQRRGPFIIGFRDAAQTDPVISIDLGDPRVRRAGNGDSNEGQAVFLPHGGRSPYLEEIIATLQVIFAGIAATVPMFTLLEELDLIEPIALQVSLSDTEHIKLEGYSTIGADRLAGLSADALDRLNRAGHITSVIYVLASLDNIARLIERQRARQAQG